MSDKLFAEVQAGASLKKTETQDKSGPVIDNEVKLKKNDRGSFLKEVESGAELKHAETNDKSGPTISGDTKVGQNNHGNLFSEIKAKGKE
ncbi:hypothetical protein PROFUN_10431 [Planoprotostelium fungivorum]|uniref:WH2 domain-containing protein n=1 Tax=Planoprotostelium fungivorum TaxID=1890364 RepID=A0A2P6NDY4_9EUKA|nr:hypothetical protein PROFUN_10431 [Planoprotostelium fungivorum]